MTTSGFSFGCQLPNNIQSLQERPSLFGNHPPGNVLPSHERLGTHNTVNNKQWQQQPQQRRSNWNSHFHHPQNYWFPPPPHFGSHSAQRFGRFVPPPCCTSPPQYQQSAPGSLFGTVSTSHTTTQKGNGLSQDFYWRDYNHGQIPHDALKGPDRKYIGQINYEGQILPACIIPEEKLAIAERAGKQVITNHIKIICSPVPEKFYWESINFNVVTDFQMANVIKGGYQDGYDLYIGKTFHDGEWKIGKVVPKENPYNKGLQVWNKNNMCALIDHFQILKYRNYPDVIKFSNDRNFNLRHHLMTW